MPDQPLTPEIRGEIRFDNVSFSYAGAGKEATLNFTGSKVWLYGTKDSGHGAANIEIDGEQVAVMNTAAGSRSTGQMIYESEDLEDDADGSTIVL